MTFNEVDESVGGRIVAAHGILVVEFGLDGLRQLLAQLDAPLIVRVDVPNDALSKDLVLVHGDEGAQRERRHLLHHDRVGRSIALEDFVRSNSIGVVHAGQLLLHFTLGLALHKGFGLSQEVAEQQFVMLAIGQVLVVAVHGGDEVAGNDFSALMYQLIKGMLTIGARLTPYNGSSGVVNGLATSGHIPKTTISLITGYPKINGQNKGNTVPLQGVPEMMDKTKI